MRRYARSADRLKVIPVERAQLESSPCYVIDLVSGEQYKISPTPKGWAIEEKDSQDSKIYKIRVKMIFTHQDA